jgi:pyruvate ferredoxin oxidoreductase alpha subunit
MGKIMAMNGDEAVAYAAKQGDVDVVAAYPITPQTIIVEKFNEFVSNGEVRAEFVCVESEHSAMSACIGASLAGGRVFTATASQGLALMHEMLYIASSLRTSIVMGVVNRALSAPINIHGDHSDVMGSRDCGWVILFSENAQEAYDNTIQAFKIAEDPEVLLPVMVCLDGFIISHSVEGVDILEDEDVLSFIPLKDRIYPYPLDPEKPVTMGSLAMPDYYFEFKAQHDDVMKRALEKILEVGREYGVLSGRRYGFLEAYRMEDADVAIISMGSTAGTVKVVVDGMREQGYRVGSLKIRSYRPFPSQELLRVTKDLKVLAVMDRAASLGAPGAPLYSDMRALFYDQGHRPLIFGEVYGLGGRDVTSEEIVGVFQKALHVAERGIIEKPVEFLGVR